MKTSIAVSVIMPSLNVVDYIDECMRSVIEQTLDNIEIICVDAGSIDGTLEKLNEYASIDPRIQIVKSEKKSYGYQINLGFSLAKGEYIAIVETDDYINREMYESLFLIAKANNLDYIKADFARFRGDGANRVFTHSSIVENERYYNEILWAGNEWSVFNGSVYPWAGIYRRSLIVDNNIRLNETPGASYQDNGLCFQVYAYGKRGYFIKNEFYYLRREEQEASYYAPHKYKEILVEFDYIYDFLIKTDFYSIFGPRFCKFKYQTFWWRANMLADEHKLEFMRLFAESFKKAQAEGSLDLRCFNENEKKSLHNLMDSPELVCWKKYFSKESTWQYEFGQKKNEKLTESRISIIGKRVLFITNELAQSGAQLSTLAQCIVLKKAGAEVEVWSLKDGVLRQNYDNNGISVKVVYANEFDRSWARDEIKQFDLAVICTVLSAPALSVCESLIPTILYIRSDGMLLSHFFNKAHAFSEEYQRFNSILEAKYVVAVSEYCGEWVSQNLNPNVKIIHNFIEDRFESYSVNSTHRKIKFLALGTIEYRKGFDIYVNAFLSLPQSIRDNCEIHFAGRKIAGEESFFDNIIRVAEQNNVFYHGELLDRDSIYQLISECDVVVVPSRNESCSRVALEGAMLGKPLIVTEDVGAKYLVDRESGWIVETGNVESLAMALKSVFANRTKLKEMGLVARKKYLNTSTTEIYTQNFVPYVERVLADYEEKRFVKKDSIKLWSFDVFDTLITRKTATPLGIFVDVQRRLNSESIWNDFPVYVKQNFYELRVNAEKLAREMVRGSDFDRIANKECIVNEEITINSIYEVFVFSNLLSKEQADRVMHLEIEMEIDSVVGISRNIDIVKKLLNEGKRVVALSDMYLDGKTIQRMLIAADAIFENVQVYASSDFLLTKLSGNLYKRVRELEGIEFSEWYHIGDNKKSDYEITKNLGMKSELYPISWRSGFENYILSRSINDETVQHHVALAKNTIVQYNLRNIQAIGVDLGTFVLIPYVDFIIQNCCTQNIKRLYFIARDGYVLKKIADTLIETNHLNISTKYIMASRKAWRVFPESVNDVDLMRLVSVSNFNYIRTIDDLANLFMISQEELMVYLPSDVNWGSINSKELYKIVQILNKNNKFKELLISNNFEKRNLMREYILQEVDMSDENYAFVELNGTGYTTYIMSKILFNEQQENKPIKTFYYWAQNIGLKTKEQKIISFFPSRIAKGSIIECLCRAPHSQVIGYKRDVGRIVPVLEKTNEAIALQKVGYEDYIYGVICATKFYKLGTIKSTLKVVEKAFDYITNSPDNEILSFLGDIPFSVTGRTDEVLTFAPKPTREDLFNVYFLRQIHNEPIEKYFVSSYFEYCLKRISKEDRNLIKCYEEKVNNLVKEKKLQKLSPNEIDEIRYDIERRCYGSSTVVCKKGKMQNVSIIDNGYEENKEMCIIDESEYRLLKNDAYCLNEIRKSFSYKIGMAITKPVRSLRNLLK